MKFGAAVHKDKLTLCDFVKHPIWVRYSDEDYRDPDGRRPLLDAKPDVSRQVLKSERPYLLCKIEGRELYANGAYDDKLKWLTDVHFWMDGKWVYFMDRLDLRPVKLVAVATILGQSNVAFYLLSKDDLQAPRVGGYVMRRRSGGRAPLAHLKLTQGAIIKNMPPAKDDRAPKAAPVELKNARLGKPKAIEKITKRDRLAHLIWVDVDDEAKYDEFSHEQPIISRDPNVSFDLLRKFLHAWVTIRTDDGKLDGIARYHGESDSLSNIQFFCGKQLRSARGLEGFSTPLRLRVLAKILGKSDATFILRRRANTKATRVGAA